MASDLSIGDELAHVFARTTGALPSRESIESVLDLLTSVAVHTVEGADAAGITLGDDGQRRTAAASHHIVEQADAAQYELGEGPCLDSWQGRRLVRADDLATETRWPQWAPAASDLGLGSSLSAPLVAGDEAVGAIKLYAERPAAFTHRDEGTLMLLAAQAAALVTSHRAFHRAGRLSDELRDAVRRRDIVNLAKGVIMGRDGTTEDAAFTHLVSLAARDGRSLHDAAARLVDAARRRNR